MMTYLKATKLAKPLASFACIALLLNSQTAHADFRKALEAYIARDGDTMLKEVKDAVDNKNDDGLMLFIDSLILDDRQIKYFLDINTTRERFDLSVVLNEPETNQLFNLLDLFAQRNSRYALRIVQKKYRFDTKKRQEYFKALAKKENADAALAYFYEMSFLNQKNTIKERAYWLKQAAYLGNSYAAYLYGESHLKKPIHENLYKSDKKIAYQWLKAALEKSDSIMPPHDEVLRSLQGNFEFSAVDVERLSKQPNLSQNKPVFSIKKEYWAGDLSSFEYKLDIYQNGQVMLLRDPVVPGEVAIQPAFVITQTDVNRIIKELTQQGYKKWKDVYPVEGSATRREVYTVRIFSDGIEKTSTFAILPEDFSLDAIINQVLTSLEKTVPFHNHSFTAIAGMKARLPNRELFLANHVTEESTK